VSEPCRPAEPRALRSGPCQARVDPFADAFPLELREGGEDVQLQLAGRRGGVDAFVQADERHADRAQFLEQDHEVAQVPPEAIEPPAEQDVELPAPCIGHELVESGPPVEPQMPRSVYSTKVQPRASA
jgi:hypothetical protein